MNSFAYQKMLRLAIVIIDRKWNIIAIKEVYSQKTPINSSTYKHNYIFYKPATGHARLNLFLTIVMIFKMQNDVQIEELSRINQEKNERLQKMKQNIQKLQLGMNLSKKFKPEHANPISIPPERQPITIVNHYEREYSSTSPINTEKQFNFNSNLFRGITNQSQPVLENGSAVSNFSSVSNINNILNGRQQNRPVPPPHTSYVSKGTIERPKEKPAILDEIDSLLQRSKKASGRYTGGFEPKEMKNYSEIEEQIETSRYSDKKGTQPTIKRKAEDYKKLIEKLDVIPENKPPLRQPYKTNKDFHERSNTSQLYDEQLIERQKIKPGHKRSDFGSNLSNNTNVEMIESYPRLPPHPSGRSSASSASSLVDRHRALIQETFQQKKKLQTEVAHENLDRTQIDLELSDDQSERPKEQQHKEEIQALLKEKRQLMAELQRISKELDELEGND